MKKEEAPRIEIDEIASFYRKIIESFPDDKLEALMKRGSEYASEQDRRRISLRDHAQYKPEVYYIGYAAFEILEERHGSDYVDKVLSARAPRNLVENIVYFFTGKLPKV